MADGNYDSLGVAQENYSSPRYRDHEANVGGTINPWNDHHTFDAWRDAADYQDGDSDDSGDNIDARQTSISGTLSQSDLAG